MMMIIIIVVIKLKNYKIGLEGFWRDPCTYLFIPFSGPWLPSGATSSRHAENRRLLSCEVSVVKL